MTKRIIKVQTNRGDLFKIPKDDITNYSVSPEEITYTLKDGTFIKFFKHSLTYICEANVEMCECKEDYVCEFKDFSPEEYVNEWEGKTNMVFSNRR